MLKKENRLLSNFEFNVVKKYGTRHSFPLFNIAIVKPTNYQGVPRVGIVVSNSFDKRATKRNYIKRVFRELVKQTLKEFPNNIWVVIYPKTICSQKNYAEISAGFTKALPEISFPH